MGASALWVVVSHGDLLKSVLAEATGAGLRGFQRFTADPASVSVIRYGERHTFLLAANAVMPDLTRYQPTPEDAVAGDAAVGGGSGVSSL